MEIRHPVHPDHGKGLDSAGLRREFLIEELFRPGEICLTYSHIDRILIGGASPEKAPLDLTVSREVFGVDSLLERREMGILNVGGPGTVRVGGETYDLDYKDCLYAGKGAGDLRFASKDPSAPAQFYFLSGTAHKSYPTRLITRSQAKQLHLGDSAQSNERTIYQFIHPDVLETCQLVMGFTELKPGNVWNTMPCHTHERRMEVYFYFEIDPDNLVFHFMGEPSETRHIVLRDRQAVISPSWSIHSGAGTGSYTFVWGMVGENQTFDDMDTAPSASLR